MFPLCRTFALVGVFNGEDRTAVADYARVGFFNALTVKNAERQVYSATKHFPQRTGAGELKPGPFSDPTRGEVPQARVVSFPGPEGAGGRIFGVVRR